MQARAADLVLVHEGDPEAELAGPEGGGVAARPCTKDDEGYRERVPYTADYILYGTR